MRYFNYNRNLLPNEYLKILDDVHDNGEAFLKNGSSIGYPAWGLLYYCIIGCLRQGENLLIETGTNYGCSSIIMGQALKDSGYNGTILTCDSSLEKVAIASDNIAKSGLTNIKIICNNSINFLNEIDVKINFAFLDSCHEKDYVVEEFDIIYKLGVDTVYFDNVGIGQVKEAIKQIMTKYNGHIIYFPNLSYNPEGQAIWQREKFYE